MITINTKSRLVRKKRLCLIILWFMTFGFIAVTCTQVTDFCLKCTIFLELKQKVVQSVHHKRKCRENHIKTEAMKFAKDVTELIGNTPLVRLNKVKQQLATHILAKLEYYNPGSSVKDRLGFALIDDAERRGKLQADSVVIE